MEHKKDVEWEQTAARLIPLAYEELRRVARQRMSKLNRNATLTPTDLVNEVLLRLLKDPHRKFESAEHLVRVAALAMHNVLVDMARRRMAVKRGGNGKEIELDTDLPIAAPADDMIRFHEACEALRNRSEEYFDLVLLRIYAGLSNEEIAESRKQSTRTVERQWKLVKAMLAAHLKAVPKEESPKSKGKRESGG